MEQRLIDANAYAAEMKTRQDACKEIMDSAKQDENWEVYDRMNTAFGVFVEAKLTLDNMPTVDAVPVVRCEKCRHGIKKSWYIDGWVLCTKPDVTDTVGNMIHQSDWFCADGERRTDEQQ